MKRQYGSGNSLLDWAVIIVAILLFSKTADVAAVFAPGNLEYALGPAAAFFYGVVSALILEGVALVLHFDHRTALSPVAQFVKWTLLAMSGVAQVYDGFLVTGAESTMSEPLKMGLQYGVPLIPLIVLVMLFAIGKLPDDGSQRPPFRGIKNIVGPAWDRLWNGESVSPNGAGTEEPVEEKLKAKKRRYD
jgi:hypothetical protein